MVLKTKQENHSDLGKQTIEKYRCWQYAQPQNQHDLEGEGAGEQRKVLFHSEKFISFKYLQSAADSTGGHLALFPPQTGELGGNEQMLEWPVA